MSTFTPQRPSPTNLVTPTFNACTAADKFSAIGGGYMLYYRNGVTATAGAIYVSEKVAVAPAGSIPANPPAPATKWSDLLVLASTFPASVDRVMFIDDVTNYIDSTNFVNLFHGGTLTTLTVAIFGPM